MKPKKLLSRLMAFDRARRLIAPGDRILAAVSGGPDSVCLAHHLARLAKRRRLKITLIRFNHGLRSRAEEAKDSRSVQKLALRLRLPLVERFLPVTELIRRERRSVEDAARFLRYRRLALSADEAGCNKAATGHQLDDQAETLLLHLLRGTKAKGLAGIPPKRRLVEAIRSRLMEPGTRVDVIRPLLPLSRKEILQYLRAYKLPFRRDKTNRSPRFTRNWVRAKVLPLLERRNPRIREHLAAIADDIRENFALPNREEPDE